MALARGTKATSRNGDAVSLAGSILESRMKIESNPQQQNVENISSSTSSNNGFQAYKKMRPKQGLIGISGKNSDKNPIQISKQKTELKKNLGEQCNEIKKSPIQTKRTRSVSQRGGDGFERNSIQLRKSKSESIKAVNDSVEGTERNGELRKVKSDLNKGNFDLVEGVEGSVEAIEKNPDGNLDENVEELDFCEDKVITSNLDNVESDELDDDNEELKEEIDEEIEKQSVDVKEIKIEEQKTIKVVIEDKKIHSSNGKELPISQIVRKQIHPKVVRKPKITKPIPVADEFKRVPKTHNKLQSLVDLIMWRDVSKSAFIFGLGTFTLISSSYTNDLNISFISVVSYVGLVYLAAIFFFRSIIFRGGVDLEDESEEEYVVGEEEAAWLLKLILPYLNDFLLKIRSLFSGDPSTTMKLAVLLFILARCGSYITIWKMAKLGFFGVFTVPKICSSYSPQLTAYGRFWVRRFRDAWESCSHKKAVSFGIFTFVWNLSSVVARIWAVFMLIVAFKYYQHSMMRDEEWAEEEDSCQRKVGGERQRSEPTTSTEIKRKKKG